MTGNGNRSRGGGAVRSTEKNTGPAKMRLGANRIWDAKIGAFEAANVVLFLGAAFEMSLAIYAALERPDLGMLSYALGVCSMGAAVLGITAGVLWHTLRKP